MPSRNKKTAKENIWLKHAVAIEKSGAKTIKELVSKLRPRAGKKPSIKGVTSADASEMLIDIGLGAFPYGFLFKDKVKGSFKDSTEKIDFNSILSSLK